MAPISPGRPSGPPRKAQKPTATTKLHRFESFTKRISNLKIDPIHHVERVQPIDEDGGLTHSNFRDALDHWADLNLSKTYTDFARKATPLSESLPQLLHHADKIFDLLVAHIEKKDAFALEPLLNLVAQFAQDLRHKFEKYFSRAVSLVAQVAASDDAPEIIEWCFTCLAWMFKFLQRLLVPDLQPLLEIMVPYLSARKAYVVRFTAESLAFLLRKAAVLYPRDESPLLKAVTYLLCSLPESATDTTAENYTVGLMTLFSEAAMGTGNALHASGAYLISSIVDTLLRGSIKSEYSAKVLEGVMISLVHQTDSEGFFPLMELVHSRVKTLNSTSSVSEVQLTLRLLYLIIATRKGSRVHDWKVVIEDLLHLSELIRNSQTMSQHSFYSQMRLSMIAMTMQYAPMHGLLPFINKMLQAASTQTTPSQYYQFIQLFANLGLDRFHSLLLPSFQQFILLHWQDDELAFCVSLHNLTRAHALGAQQNSRKPIPISLELEGRIAELVSRASPSAETSFEVLANGYLQLVGEINVVQDYSNMQHLQEVLHRILLEELHSSPKPFVSASQRFTFGRLFATYLQLASVQEDVDASLWTPISRLPPDHFRLLPFLRALTSYALHMPSSASTTDHEVQRIQEFMFNNLLSEDPELKILSLEILKYFALPSSPATGEAIGLALEIMRVPYAPHQVRHIIMLLRRLPRHQKNLSGRFQRLIPLLCMGLLPIYHDQTRETLCSVLGELALEAQDETVILDIAMKWLQSPGSAASELAPNEEKEVLSKLTPFQCTNVLAIDRDVQTCSIEYEDTKLTLMRYFERDHQVLPLAAPVTGRSIALQLFQTIPEVAEKRSRLLIPVFLSAQSNQKSDHVVASDESTSSRTLSPSISEADWTLRDRKAFIELFTRFKNPRVLYRSEEVFAALLELLMNGNVDFQRLALKAIYTWKDPSLIPHYDSLVRLLDDKTFSTELALLLNSDLEQSQIEVSQRPYLMDIILRLLYGQMIGRGGSHGSQEGKRRTILRMIMRLPGAEISQFLRLTFRGLANVSLFDGGNLQTEVLDVDLVPVDQQYGLLRMLYSVMEVLQSQLAPIGNETIHPVLYCTARACRQLNSADSNGAIEGKAPVPAMVRNIRKVGLQCLDMLFKHCDEMDWSPYLDLIFAEIVRPRLSAFAIETAQGVSWLLRIFSTWSYSPNLVRFLSECGEDLLGNVLRCLTTPTVKDEVKLFVLDEVLIPVTAIATDHSQPCVTAVQLLQSNAQKVFEHLAIVLEQRPSKLILQSTLAALPALTAFARSPSETHVLLKSLLQVLNDANLHVSPKIRGTLLRAVESLIEVHGSELDSGSRYQAWTNVSLLFNYFKDAHNRTVLCNVLDSLARGQDELCNVAKLCRDLNSVSSETLAELDIDRQIKAFESVKDIDMSTTNGMAWQPVLNNLLYYSRTSEDFSVRSNAVSCLRYFVAESCRTNNHELEVLVKTSLLPAFRKGVSEDSEVLRADFVSLFGLVVLHLPDAPELEDLKSLLVQNDDEASFFGNILHIQQHRRQRALHRLISEVGQGSISAANIATFFLPLLEKFVDNVADDPSAQGLKGQSISAIGSLVLGLEWKQFRATFRRFRSDMGGTKTRSEKDAVKLLGVSADALIKSTDSLKCKEDSAGEQISHLSSSLPTSDKIAQELKTHFIPQLTAFVHLKDESQISLRLPAAVTVVKLMKLLPEGDIASMVPGLLLDIAQILRSRAQESRDAARTALSEIVVLLGPSSLHFVLKELRSSLNRGYQLHVVSYVVHSILLVITPHLANGALDYCLSDLVSVVMDDIFGVVGQEKENEDYTSSMKEVKSSKSYDSMELIAKCTGVHALSKLLRPLQAILQGNLNSKQARQVDELLRRTGMGLSRNEAASSRDLLTFSYELIQDFYGQKTGNPERKVTTDENNRQRYLVQPAFASKSAGGISSPLLYKIPRFALDIVRSTFLKHVTLLTPQNVHGFLPIIGDALIEAQEDVKTSAMRLLSAVIKLPLPELDENAELYVAEAVKVVKNSVSTNNESSQAALKLIAAILRERRTVEVRHADLSYLLHRIIPDLERPDRQGVTFNFVKAVMARKTALPEVYELADKLGVMMVTNHARDARDVARGVYVRFLLDYPQTKSRWMKQLKFLLKNLEYNHPEGRQSIMEALNTILSKIGDDMVQEMVATFFIPVALRMANEDNKECQEMAEALLGQLFSKADSAQLSILLAPLRAWMEQTENAALTKLGMQAFGIFFEVSEGDTQSEIPQLRSNIEKILAMRSWDEYEDWEPVYQALQLTSKIVMADPGSIMSRKQANLWSSICSMQSHPQVLVQSAVAGVISTWFHDLARTNADSGLISLPLTGKYGLALSGETMLDLMRSMLRLIKRSELSDDLTRQLVRNLMFIGRCTCVNSLTVQIKDISKADEAENDGDEDSDSEDEETEQATKDIPAILYLFHQCASILRHEPVKYTTASLNPKSTILQLITTLLPHIPITLLPQQILQTLLLPLTHLTDPHVTAPRSADPTFAPAYSELTTAAQLTMEAVQKKVGDAEYVKAMTGVARAVRERRKERRVKRVIERVSEPERAARKKMRVGERKQERKRELVSAFRRGRRGA